MILPTLLLLLGSTCLLPAGVKAEKKVSDNIVALPVMAKCFSLLDPNSGNSTTLPSTHDSQVAV